MWCYSWFHYYYFLNSVFVVFKLKTKIKCFSSISYDHCWALVYSIIQLCRCSYFQHEKQKKWFFLLFLLKLKKKKSRWIIIIKERFLFALCLRTILCFVVLLFFFFIIISFYFIFYRLLHEIACIFVLDSVLGHWILTTRWIQQHQLIINLNVLEMVDDVKEAKIKNRNEWWKKTTWLKNFCVQNY